VAGALDVTRKTHPFGAVVDLSRQLREKDVEFVFVVFPSRLNLYPELVVPEVEKPPNLGDLAAATTGFLRLLNENDVETVDLVPAFVAARTLPPPTGAPEEKVAPGQLYRGHDLHWAQHGAELGAEIVAARLRQMPWFKEGPLAPGAGFELEDVPDGGWHRVRWSPGMPARDARDSPIVVLGDSFVTQHDEEGSSFADHLARFTGWPTDVLAPLGGAELRCRQLLAGRGDDLKGKKVVIWLLSDGLLRIATGFRPIPIFGEKPEAPDAPSRPRREKKDGDR
jgi:hypothetical protein